MVLLNLTGAGQTKAEGVDGLVAADPTGLSVPLLHVSAEIGGLTARVLYAGTSVGTVNGAIQVNLLVPDGFSPGDQPVVGAHRFCRFTARCNSGHPIKAPFELNGEFNGRVY